MTTSADVARHAGVSRSTVSQIFNGHERLFADETVAKVRASAEDLGYRPSVAGRTLVRGTSDIVITLVPDVTFNPRLRELIDVITEGLAKAGLTNLLRFAGTGESLQDTILGLRPYGIVSLAPLADDQRDRLRAQGVRLVEQTASRQAAIDEAIGRMQAQHLADSGCRSVVVAVPKEAREQLFAAPREAGVTGWATEHGIRVLPTLHVTMAQGGATEAISQLPDGPVGIAAYNDEVGLALVGALLAQGRSIPDEIGVIGIDNSSIAHAATPSLTTVDYDIAFSGHEIVKLILGESGEDALVGAEHEVEKRLRVVPGQTTRR